MFIWCTASHCLRARYLMPVNTLSSESYNLRDPDATGTAASFALNYELEAKNDRGNGRL